MNIQTAFPRFIVFEGIDGCGKTTQHKMISEMLVQRGERVELTGEPTNGEIGRLLRRYLSGEIKTDASAVAALFSADRIDHITSENGIDAMLERGSTVLCDRYYFSSYAYQGVGCTLERVMKLNEYPAFLRRPDITIYLDISEDIAIERISVRGGKTEIYEKIECLRAVRRQYLKAIELTHDTENVAVIDGSGTPDDVARRIMETIRPQYHR